MKPIPLHAPAAAPLRCVGSSLALVAALAFALQPGLSLAQIQVVDPDQPAAKAQPKSAPPAKARKASRHTPTDNVSDDLNRRESERVAQMMQAQSAPPAPTPIAPAKPAATASSNAPAMEVVPRVLTSAPGRPVEEKSTDAKANPNPSEPPTIAAIPPRAHVMTASLTPDLATPPPASLPAATSPMVTAPTAPLVQPPRPQQPVPQQQMPRLAQTTPPAPVPVQPQAPTGAVPPAATVVTGAPSRSFAQSQLVPTQQPTLTLEINKGTALKLPGPAATVFVAAPDIADVQVKSPTMIYVFAKKPGDTVLYAVDDQDRVLLNTIVTVTSPVSRMKATLDTLYPNNQVTIENQGETIVLGGIVRSAQIAEDARRMALQHVNGNPSKVVSTIRVDAPNQVQLRVKVAEVRREALKRVGINWQNINGLGIAPLIGTLNGGFAISTITATGGAASAAARIQGQNFDTLLDFLATNNEATILAEPNLVAMSGEMASFLAGGEIPIIAPQAGSATSTFSVAYKQVGVSLAFTPTIVGERINLKVAPEVSQLSSTGSINVPLTATAVVTIPAVQTRRASTTIELGSGQSFAIAGLLQSTSQQDIKKLPWLGDVPILGALFKSDAYQRAETELVIVITPYFVEPTSGHLKTPLTGRVPPTDADRLLFQRYNHPTPPQRMSGSVGPRAAGPTAGFKLD
jgi:pilus assembly protein CpaC